LNFGVLVAVVVQVSAHQHRKLEMVVRLVAAAR
jgi:hypothetical protein